MRFFFFFLKIAIHFLLLNHKKHTLNKEPKAPMAYLVRCYSAVKRFRVQAPGNLETRTLCKNSMMQLLNFTPKIQFFLGSLKIGQFTYFKNKIKVI